MSDALFKKLLDAVVKAKRVFICGNGGSAANAIHMANDLISVGIKAHALTADVATLTAIANDFSYSDVFSRQIRVFAEKGDLLICLSGSGRSGNIVQAVATAKRLGVTTCGIFGDFNLATTQAECDIEIRAGTGMQAAEEAQIRLGHRVMLALRDQGK